MLNAVVIGPALPPPWAPAPGSVARVPPSLGATHYYVVHCRKNARRSCTLPVLIQNRGGPPLFARG